MANTKDAKYGLANNSTRPIDGITIFAVFFVAAFAIERLLEPLSILLIPKENVADDLSSAMATAKDATISFYQALAARNNAAWTLAELDTDVVADPLPFNPDVPASKEQQDAPSRLTAEQEGLREALTRDAEKAKTRGEEELQAATETLKKAQTDAQAKLDVAAASLAVYQDNDYYRTVIFWAFATIVAMVGSALLNLYFLRAVGISSASRWVEILATGLIIGAGTKPLHDLMTAIEARKKPN